MLCIPDSLWLLAGLFIYSNLFQFSSTSFTHVLRVFPLSLVPCIVAVAISCGIRRFCIPSIRPYQLSREGRGGGFKNLTVSAPCNMLFISLS